jgi:hypothetical protein
MARIQICQGKILTVTITDWTTGVRSPAENFCLIMLPGFRVKLCAYGHSVAILIHRGCVTTVSAKYSLTKKRVHTHTIVETLKLHLYLNYETNEDVIVAVVL